MIPHGILGEALDDGVLIRVFSVPVFQALHHLALYLRVRVVEIWVESKNN